MRGGKGRGGEWREGRKGYKSGKEGGRQQCTSQLYLLYNFSFYALCK